MAQPSGSGEGGERAFRLADARSAYLRSAAGQAIDWHPWGTEPFELARRTGRPLLVDIGASWCHWCHVMDETTYSDPEVARTLRQYFVAVKVDRDEHPEVDRRFQRQVSALTGEGGWPLTAFVTPDGAVFLGGTFFPPTDGHGRPGFRRVLREVARLWREEPERVAGNAREVQEALGRIRDTSRARDRELASFVVEVSQDVRATYDPANGGFGSAPKFPHPSAISLLLWADDPSDRTGGSELARETLLRMADGGMYDQIAGGFHRYSVDSGWHIPHFEKMAVDNAALLGSYLDGLKAFGEPRLEQVLRGTIGWAREVLGDPDGGWGASQDADNAPGDDGSYFTWTRAELKELLSSEEFRLVVRTFGVDTDARMPHDPSRNVLFRMLPPEEAADGLGLSRAPGEVLSGAVAKLKTARDRRPRPTVDQALYADLNGRFIASFARSARTIGDPRVLDDARRAADRWIRTAFSPDRGMAHRIEPSGGVGYGLLDDQVSFAAGLVELAAAVPEPAFLTVATSLFELIEREFRGDDGLLMDIAPRLYDGPRVGGISEASYPLEDTPHLAANAAAALALLRVAALSHEDRWLERARTLVRSITARVAGAGLFAAGSALAAGLLTTLPATVVVDGSGPRAEELLRVADHAWHPNIFVFRGFPPAPFSVPFEGVAGGKATGPRAYVCIGSSCAPPVEDPRALVSLLKARRTTPIS